MCLPVFAQIAEASAKEELVTDVDALATESAEQEAELGEWSSVTTRALRRKSRAATLPSGKTSVPAVVRDMEPGCCKNVVEIYYDRKELFCRGWQSGAKQPRSAKLRRKTEYQKNKRQEQSCRARGFLVDNDDE